MRRRLAHSSDDMPERDIVPDLAAADAFMAGERRFPVAVIRGHCSAERIWRRG